MAPMQRAVLSILATSFLAIFAAQMVLGQGQEKITPTRREVHHGIVTVTTSEDGMWTFVTIRESQPEGKQKPISDGFALQFDNPTSSPIVFKGEGDLELLSFGDRDLIQMLALAIRPEKRDGWFFKLEQCACEAPAKTTLIEPVGIAHYEWNPQGKGAFTSHEEFAKQLSEDLAAPRNRPAGRGSRSKAASSRSHQNLHQS